MLLRFGHGISFTMTIEEIQAVCRELPGVTEDIKWDDHLCFCVAEKMFLVAGLDKSPVSSSFKVTEEEFEELSAKPGFSPAQYLARYHWIYTDNISRLTRQEWEQYIAQSYRLVAAKLPKKTQRQLGLIS